MFYINRLQIIIDVENMRRNSLLLWKTNYVEYEKNIFCISHIFNNFDGQFFATASCRWVDSYVSKYK